ncbi:hypothetical protein G6F65_017351 [Rhizopus arrhizus]|nr:hypothetical protein G6F65_017351 [Rhizopus arrhizus]
MLDATIGGAALALFTMPLFGVLGDKIGHKWVFMAGTVGILICAPVFFNLLGSGDKAWIIVAVCLAVGLVYACLYGPEGTLFSSQFPAHVRYTGISLAVQVSGAIGGGLAPIVATWLLAKGGGDPKYVVWYLSALGVVAFFSAWRMQASGDPLPARGLARRLCAHRRRAAWAALARTPGLSRGGAGALVRQARHPRQSATGAHVPGCVAGLAHRHRGRSCRHAGAGAVQGDPEGGMGGRSGHLRPRRPARGHGETGTGCRKPAGGSRRTGHRGHVSPQHG